MVCSNSAVKHYPLMRSHDTAGVVQRQSFDRRRNVSMLEVVAMCGDFSGVLLLGPCMSLCSLERRVLEMLMSPSL